ncbi:MAG: serine hydrolase domain-containing protein [Vicinamibacterales bacterium]|nr:serine hydrolase domain-containing protein [Vicinamibacterales bacterium]
MNTPTSRFGRTLRLSLASLPLLTAPLLSACGPICETVNSWSACYFDVHRDDASAVRSEIDEAPAAAHTDAVERARPLARAFVADENLPGLSLAVGVAGEVVWAEGFGWADIDERRLVTPSTLFRIGSVAKPMTAAAVGLLVERGLLGLDAPVRDYVPGFPEKAWPVTTRQLMGHVAGVRHYGDDDELLYMRGRCASPGGGLERFADDALHFPPPTPATAGPWSAPSSRRPRTSPFSTSCSARYSTLRR